jgi:hypothetical protein
MAARVKAVEAERRQVRELANGTLEVKLFVAPVAKAEFHRLFPDLGMPCTLVPVKPAAPSDVPKGGELARLAGILCGDAEFQVWIEARHPTIAEGAEFGDDASKVAAHIVRTLCGVESRAELDHDPEAARRFHELVRKPWSERKAS